MNPVFHRPMVNSAGVSGCNLCEAHLFIGMTRLAEGDRAGARELVRKSVVARVFEFFEHDRIRALLVRLEQNPDWRPWIRQSALP